MFYRIVLQGCAGGGHDLATVKREFIRVTGLPENVTERLFARTPLPLKERVAQADAERIAATLRAIGAAVTVEHDRLASLVAVDDGVHELLAPEHRGPPTIVPGSEPAAAPVPPTAAQRLRRRLQRFVPLLVGAPLALVALVVLAPIAEELLYDLHPSQAAAPEAVRRPRVEAPAPTVRPSAKTLHGPWRCTDQNTGLSVFWTFGADGSLIYHGETFSETAAPIAGPDIATGWQFAERQLVFTFAQRRPVTYTTTELNISRLRYGDGEIVDIQCRRP